ncbi:MAG: ATPase, T2SS/T4P/T4SS family, partial [Nanoarchaeota archaeon]|nr:ATPase, T2SS/T4P/T4SS family [Nanoarchaeota archaeon]
DEANPVLDTDLGLGDIKARIAVIQQPLSPDGLAYAIRRHREEPWTLPLFIKNKMLNSFCSGLFSFLLDGTRTLLIGGTRSSGKTSLLGALMLEIMPKIRCIVIEDTAELPVEALRKLKYDILRMKVRSTLLKTSTEIGADEGIRTALRLGDSSLIVGEVRSLEAKALYEAMRVGALANVVAGTIHGASPYGIFDRVVNDLEVPVTSFKATDCIIIANPVKTSDGLKSMKRVVQLAEVRKHWIKDPEEEGGFVDLLKYNVEKDELEPSEELINGDSEIIKDIAAGVKGWGGNWDAVYDNILLRGQIKQEIVDVAEKNKIPDLLESKFNSLSNNMFHQFSKQVQEDVGLPVGKMVFPLWQEWLMKEVKKMKI